MMRTLLIVDDHDAFRARARQVLSDDGFDVVGEARDGASAISEIRVLRPAITLLDIVLPDMTGFAVAARVAAWTRVVLTSSRDLEDFGPQPGLRVAGFIPKAELTGSALARVVDGVDD